MEVEINRHLRHNFIVNVMDGAFFGLALGFASFVTVLPLFVSTMTNSAVLIGLIPAIHNVGWQLPQLFTARQVTGLSRYKPMVVMTTIHERLPFLGLAAVAWFLPRLGREVALVLTFGLLTWQGLGGGFTATAWQSMIGKIIPARHRGFFLGTQAAAASLFASGGAILAGVFLERLGSPLDWTTCFLLTSVSMAVSWVFLAKTREPDRPPADGDENRSDFWRGVIAILQRDINFRWFLSARLLSQMAAVAFAFYTIYAVRCHGMTEGTAGLMTGALLAAQMAANPLMGWIGDRWSHRAVMAVSALAATASALLAWWAPDTNWFYLVFILAGVANVAFWTTGLTLTLEFGAEAERPAYIGLANTLVAPGAILAPLVGGWLADSAGYPAVFLASAVCGLLTALILRVMVQDPRHAPCCRPRPIGND